MVLPLHGFIKGKFVLCFIIFVHPVLGDLITKPVSLIGVNRKYLAHFGNEITTTDRAIVKNINVLFNQFIVMSVFNESICLVVLPGTGSRVVVVVFLQCYCVTHDELVTVGQM